jgi:hypothetical protein
MDSEGHLYGTNLVPEMLRVVKLVHPFKSLKVVLLQLFFTKFKISDVCVMTKFASRVESASRKWRLQS